VSSSLRPFWSTSWSSFTFTFRSVRQGRYMDFIFNTCSMFIILSMLIHRSIRLIFKTKTFCKLVAQVVVGNPDHTISLLKCTLYGHVVLCGYIDILNFWFHLKDGITLLEGRSDCVIHWLY